MSDSSPDYTLPRYYLKALKYYFGGILIAVILHGIVIALFCQCMGALFSPTNRKHKAGGIRWELVALTTAMLLFSTTSLTLSVLGSSMDFPGVTAYEVNFDIIAIIQSSMFSLNQWLADGLLLYRCHVIYARNYRVTAFPCLMYLASVLLAILLTYANFTEGYIKNPASFPSVILILYLAITFSLNILLTLMIVARLALCNKEIQDVMGTSSRAGELYKAAAMIFVESCAPYAISLLLYIITWRSSGPFLEIFYQTFIETQVIAPFLIILRLVNGTAVTSDSTIGSRTVDPARFIRSHEDTTGSYGVFPDEGPVGSTDALNELSVGDGMAIEEVPLSYDGRS